MVLVAVGIESGYEEVRCVLTSGREYFSHPGISMNLMFIPILGLSIFPQFLSGALYGIL